MVWGGISFHGKTDLVVIEGNLKSLPEWNSAAWPSAIHGKHGS